MTQKMHEVGKLKIERTSYHPNQRLEAARREIKESKLIEEIEFVDMSDCIEDDDQMCRTCFHPTAHFAGCPDDESPYAEFLRNGYS